jgi:HAD superfamily hydrolase (TIGR01484 family)
VANTAWLRKNEALVARYHSLDSALDGDPLEILFTGPMEVITEIIRRLGNGSNGNSKEELAFRLLRAEYPKRDFAILDAIHGTCSKGHALAHWSRLRGIAPEEIMAIGDNYNDLEMLRFAGCPVVMGNADAVLKSNGWPVTLDCDSSGVAHAVREYAL